MKNKQKNRIENHAANPRQPVPAATPSRRGLVIAVILATVAAVVTWAIFENVVWSQVPEELVGKWEVVGGQQDGATFDFYRNGAMVGHINMGGQQGIVHATVRVDGKNIYSTTRHPQTGKQNTTVLVMQSLTATALVVVDERGQTMTMKRAT